MRFFRWFFRRFLGDFMDNVDRANNHAAKAVERAIAGRIIYVGESADSCVVCGYLIPSARQVALRGVDTCVGCSALQELSHVG